MLGFDQPSAEVFVNLATGATLPDAGEVSVFGRPTAAIADSADWLATVDRFGIVSERAVLLDALTVDPEPGDAVHAGDRAAARRRARARRGAGARGRAAGGDRGTRRSRELDAAGRLRVRFGRAIALDPAVLLLEHASASVAA